MSVKGFKELMQGMSAKEKLEYLWEYYKWVLLVLGMVAMVTAMVVTGIVNKNVPILYSGAAVNVPVSAEGMAFLSDEWAQKLDAGKKEKVQLFSTSFRDLETSTDLEMDAANAYQVALMASVGDFDYVIMDEVALAYYKNHSIFTPLNEMFPEEVMEEYSGSIIWHQPEDGTEFPLAIDITQSAFAQKYIAQETKVYIAFPGNTGRTQLNGEFLDYLMKAA